MDVVTEASEDTAESEAEGCSGDEPAWTHVFAERGARNFEEDVADIERGEDRVVVVFLEIEILFKTSETGIANVGSVNEAWRSVSMLL